MSKNFGDPHENGDPYCLTFARECPAKPHLDLSTKVYKMEQSTSSLSVQIQNGNDTQLAQGVGLPSTTYITIFTTAATPMATPNQTS